MFRTIHCVALAGLTIATIACGVDRATAPGSELPSAAVGSSPAPLDASPVSDVSIALSWVDNSPNEAGFEIHRSTTGATGVFTRVATTTQSATGYTDPGLTPLTQYCYEVRAYRMNGGKAVYSTFSNVACATTLGPPPAPTAVTASPREYGAVVVSWSSGATSFRVDRAAAPGGPWAQIATPSSSPYFDSGRAQEQLVCYQVSAVNQWGATPSTAACTTPPATPANVAVSAPSTGSGLDVAWSDVSAVEQGYEIQRATDNYAFATVGTAPANATSYHDATAAFDVRYWYRVRATKDGGYTDFSNWADGINSSTVPSAPTGLSTIPISSGTVDVVWTSTSTNGTGFRVERSTDGGAWTTAATVPWSQSEIYDSGLTPEAQDCYRVIAFNAKGDSPPSPTDCSRPIAGPQDLASPSSTSDAVDLTWTDASAYETGYEIHRIECTGYGYYYYNYCYVAESATVGAGVTSYHFARLAAGTTYVFEVVAFAVKDGRTYYSDTSPQIYASTAP